MIWTPLWQACVNKIDRACWNFAPLFTIRALTWLILLFCLWYNSIFFSSSACFCVVCCWREEKRVWQNRFVRGCNLFVAVIPIVHCKTDCGNTSSTRIVCVCARLDRIYIYIYFWSTNKVDLMPLAAMAFYLQTVAAIISWAGSFCKRCARCTSVREYTWRNCRLQFNMQSSIAIYYRLPKCV